MVWWLEKAKSNFKNTEISYKVICCRYNKTVNDIYARTLMALEEIDDTSLKL